MTDDYLRALAELIRPTIRKVLEEELQELNQDHPSENFITIDEAAELTGLSKHTIYARTSPGFVRKHGKTIPFHKQGKRLYFRRSELLNWIDNEA